MRFLACLAAVTVAFALLGVQGVSAQLHRSGSRVVVISGPGHHHPGSHVVTGHRGYPDRYGYVSSSGGRRSYRGLYGRDGLALQRSRAIRSRVYHSDLYGSTVVTDYRYGSPVVRYGNYRGYIYPQLDYRAGYYWCPTGLYHSPRHRDSYPYYRSYGARQLYSYPR